MTYMLEGEARVILISAGNFCGQNQPKAKNYCGFYANIVVFYRFRQKRGKCADAV